MRKKFYFAGSITGGRSDSNVYAELIRILKKHGNVLTEHIGDPNLLSSGEQLEPKQIHDRDVDWLVSSAAVVADITVISDGVGYELGRVVERNKGSGIFRINPIIPILALYRPSVRTKVSAMIAGAPYVTVAPYETFEEAEHIIESFLGKHSLLSEPFM